MMSNNGIILEILLNLVKYLFIDSVDSNELENRLNNQSHQQRTMNNLNNVLVNNNLNLNSSFTGTNNLNNTASLLICNNSPNNLTLASSSVSPTSSTSTLQGKIYDKYRKPETVCAFKTEH